MVIGAALLPAMGLDRLPAWRDRHHLESNLATVLRESLSITQVWFRIALLSRRAAGSGHPRQGLKL